ncbi:MAG: biotin synthase BioB [Candidatus Omnitrophota bacterium]
MTVITEHIDTKCLVTMPLADILSMASEVRRTRTDGRLEICGITNAKSGICKEDCKYCAQSSHHAAAITPYPLKDIDVIVREARQAKENGAEKFGIVTSGNRLTVHELEVIARAIREIRTNVGIVVCGSLGALTKSEMSMLADAGLTRYHHNIETSPRFYPTIVSTHTIDERIATITAARELGLEACSGGIIGMGETWQDRIDMAELLLELDVTSVPINILVPIKGTPMESIKPMSCIDVIRTIAIFRIILKDKVIKIAAGRESILKDFQAMGFMAGANGMLIGGYLTIKGRTVDEDRLLIKEIRRLWAE